MLRVALFAATNVAVLIVLSIFSRIFGLEQSMGPGNLNGLLIMSAIFGMSGSIISLLMSKKLAKRSVGAQVIETPTNETERWMLQTVQRHSDAAGITMPEVAIYNSSTVNAFATGARKNAALVAVSTGLLNSMSRSEAEAVIGHEISHVANGDMVTLTLVQGVVNTFVIFFSRIVGMLVDSALSRGQSSGRMGMGYFLSSMVAQVVLGFLASMIVAWFSRYREFRADEGGAKLAGTQNMVGALERLKGGAPSEDLPESLSAFGISSGLRRGVAQLFATHPPLDVRIEALRRKASPIQ
ncbi:MAG: protease HtpX [Gammaproteobacteria bacterium]